MKQFIDGICEQLQQAIEIGSEGKKELNLIKTGRDKNRSILTADFFQFSNSNAFTILYLVLSTN